MGARQNQTPPCENASRTGSYFTGGTSGSPCGSGDELQQSAFLMGNLDGAGRMGKRAPTTNCLHCQLAGASFFSVLLLPLGEEGWRLSSVRWRLFGLLRCVRRSPPVVGAPVHRPPEEEFPDTRGTGAGQAKPIGEDGLPHQLCRYRSEAASGGGLAARPAAQSVGWTVSSLNPWDVS